MVESDREKQKWEGIVTSIQNSNGYCYANLTRMDTDDYETLELQFPVSCVIKKDRKLIKPGVFIDVALEEITGRYVLHGKIKVQKTENGWENFDIKNIPDDIEILYDKFNKNAC